jgi:hypothetical protein
MLQPLTHIMATASILWIGDIQAIIKFNDYLLELGTNTTGGLTAYVDW